MKALIRKSDGVLEQWVLSTEGYDLALFNVVDAPNGSNPDDLVWNGAAFVARAKRPAELARDALTTDILFAKLKSATPTEIDDFLATNTATEAQKRRLFKFLLLAIRQLMDRNAI